MSAMIQPRRFARPYAMRWFHPLVALLLIGMIASGRATPVASTAVLTSTPVSGDADEAGLPFVRNFGPTEYGGAPQNWAMIQGLDGVMYLGNVDDGLFAFDGARWRRIPIANRSAVRSLDMDKSGRIYVGAVGDFGYLDSDTGGQMHYVSLLDRVPPAEREFTDVWKTLAGPDGVYFTTRTHVFRVRGNQVQVWKTTTAFHMGFLVRGTLYIREIGRGLLKLVDGKLLPVPGGERFAAEKIYIMLPWDGPGAKPGEMLLGTHTQGWLLFDGSTYRPWSSEADAVFKGKRPYAGLWLSTGELAVAALPDGVFLLDRAGHLVRHITRASGLANDSVNALYEDHQQGLWVTSDVGVSRIAVGTPLSQFNEQAGLVGAALALGRHAGQLYAGTTEGLFRLDPAPAGGARFTRLPDWQGMVWALLETEHGMLVADQGGVSSITDGAPARVLPSDSAAFSMLRSRRDPARVFVGMQDGLISLRWDGRSWIDEGRIRAIHDELRSLFEDAEGHLWAGTWNSNVLRITIPQGWPGANHASAPVQVERFGTDQGVPVGQPLIIAIDGKLRFATTAGIYEFDDATGRLVPDPRFAHVFPAGTRQVAAAHQDAQGKLWMYTADINRGLKESGSALPDAQGNWHWSATPLQPIAGSGMTDVMADTNGVVWFGGEQGLFRYDPTATVPDDARFSTLLREVSVIKRGRLSGHGAQLPYANNALRFDFAAPSYDTYEANRFQVWLQGLDSGWSPWSGETYRDYTNLPDGDYRFLVRARNVYGKQGTQAVFDFRVLPPWYRTGWAWTLWGAFAVLVLGLLMRWRSATLRKRNRALAALVAQRTGELEDANRALAEQTITDPLTGLKNRRYLHDHIEQDIAMARRHYLDPDTARCDLVDHNVNLLFLMVDIDHFKEVNDTHGHAAGDRVLQQFRDILMAATRETDTPVRWGGEEFLVVARFTNRESGPLFAERIRSLVAAQAFDLGDGRFIHRTCSVGFASYPFFPAEPDRLNWEQVVNLADECLYAAKRSGRDAWVGVEAGPTMPAGSITEALHRTLEGACETGPLRVLESRAAALA